MTTFLPKPPTVGPLTMDDLTRARHARDLCREQIINLEAMDCNRMTAEQAVERDIAIMRARETAADLERVYLQCLDTYDHMRRRNGTK